MNPPATEPESPNAPRNAEDEALAPEPDEAPRPARTVDPGLKSFVLDEAETGLTLAAVLRGRLGGTWNAARTLCEGGKVFLGGKPLLDPARRMTAGQALEIKRNARVPPSQVEVRAAQAIVYEDSQLIVLDKPAGIQSVPYERGDTDTAMDLIRTAWRTQGRQATQQPLHIVHRIDKETSGLLLFAKTRGAERALQALWRAHDIERRYLCVVHGRVTDRRIESQLVEDRGDGIRGSLRPGMKVPGGGLGKRAITHIEALEEFGGVATLCAVRLETGKTHQIRIHMAESGHPILGETVYIRDYVRRGFEPLPSVRLMLHAETLGLVHPATGETVRWVSKPPPAFRACIGRLRQLTRAGTGGSADETVVEQD